ncbi:unnamed protein product [Effrenium voratum]|nr:unnamed protein product [Effrenium voratum]
MFHHLRSADEAGVGLANLPAKRAGKGIPEVSAERVLDVFSENGTASLAPRIPEDSESIEAKEPPPAHGINMSEFFSETASDWTRRMQRLSRYKRWQLWLQSNEFEMMISAALCINVLWMAVELQIQGWITGHDLGITYTIIEDTDMWYTVFLTGDMIFAFIFGVEVLLRALILGCAFWKSWMNYVDMIVSIISIVELLVFMDGTRSVSPLLFRLLRMGKLTRAMRVVSMTSVLASLQLLLKCLVASRDMLFWSFCLLTFVQCIAGMILTTLCWDFVRDTAEDAKIREEVFRYYGTFTRTFLSMFEIMFANWSPPCRVLVENVSEWFSIFFLTYRCVLGFAVLNVVNAVFVQQTMKTASSDEDLAFKQREKDIAMYHRKVKKLFATMDSSGDGAINFEEFSKLVKSPKLRFWMSQLELEYHDLLSLFEFLDNGDGQITLSEFIDGAARLRGSAKAIDVWRMETKVEVLFEEVLNLITSLQNPEEEDAGTAVEPDPGSPPLSPNRRGSTSIQDIFNQSAFRHIKEDVTMEELLAKDEKAFYIAKMKYEHEAFYIAKMKYEHEDEAKKADQVEAVERSDVADSKEQMILRAVCDERISVPVESLQQFSEVYKAILQLVLDEPPEGLYNRWVKERLEYYRRVEPSAPLRDVSIVDQKELCGAEDMEEDMTLARTCAVGLAQAKNFDGQGIEEIAARVARNGFQVVDLSSRPPCGGDALFYRARRVLVRYAECPALKPDQSQTKMAFEFGFGQSKVPVNPPPVRRQQSPEQVVQVEEIFFEAPPMMSDASPSSNRLRLETISNENPRRRSSKTSLSSKNANVLRTSEAFQGLLDRLAQQHLQDVWEGDDPVGIEELEIYAHQLQREVERAQAPQKAADGPARRKPWTESFAFDAFIATLVGLPFGQGTDLNVLWMAFQLQLQGSQAANDLGISQWMEVAPVTPNLVVLRILRFARFARALRLVAMSAALASLQLLIKCLIACKSMLLWSFCLLAFVQSVAGLVISSICWDFIRDPSADHFGREQACAREGLVAAPGSQ